LKPVGKFIADKDGDKWLDKPEEEWLNYFRDIAGNMMMDSIRADLAKAGIHFDVFASEKAIAESGGIEEALKVLTDAGLVYKGILEKPKSAKAPEDWEPQEMLIFKSTEFGDEADRPLARADGTYTYFMPDIAYQYDKFKRGFKKLIMVLGADHAGYVTRLKSAVKAVTYGQANLDMPLVQMVSFSQNGEPVKMSKRAGTIVLFSDLLEEIDKDVVRFFMLTRKNDSQLDFDLVKVKEQSKDNPVFYVQYAHARAYSVFRKAADMFGADVMDNLQDVDFALLKDEAEVALIRQLVEFPRQVELAAQVNEPHRIAYYLNDLASGFHALWNKGRDDVQMRFLDEKNPELSKARLALIQAVCYVIASGLGIFGVQPVKEM
jgi:arginyl-tRNA synthetase